MTLKNKRIEWKARYDAWKSSDQNIAEWCRHQEVNVTQMYYWVQRFERDGITPALETAETQWLTVQVDNNFSHSKGVEPIFIHFGAITVEMRPGTDMNLLSDIVQVLQNRC